MTSNSRHISWQKTLLYSPSSQDKPRLPALDEGSICICWYPRSSQGVLSMFIYKPKVVSLAILRSFISLSYVVSYLNCEKKWPPIALLIAWNHCNRPGFELHCNRFRIPVPKSPTARKRLAEPTPCMSSTCEDHLMPPHRGTLYSVL